MNLKSYKITLIPRISWFNSLMGRLGLYGLKCRRCKAWFDLESTPEDFERGCQRKPRYRCPIGFNWKWE